MTDTRATNAPRTWDRARNAERRQGWDRSHVVTLAWCLSHHLPTNPAQRTPRHRPDYATQHDVCDAARGTCQRCTLRGLPVGCRC
jgi:hypothetical protein